MGDDVKYWLELAEYDLETAKAMLQTERYLYVGFMCHQTAEKILKAYFSRIKNETAPYTHSLAYLIRLTNLETSLPEEFADLMDVLEPMNVEARYPSYKEKLLADLNKSRCEMLLEQTNQFIEWIKNRL
jgi:HEPN domain-containing protein